MRIYRFLSALYRDCLFSRVCVMLGGGMLWCNIRDQNLSDLTWLRKKKPCSRKLCLRAHCLHWSCLSRFGPVALSDFGQWVVRIQESRRQGWSSALAVKCFSMGMTCHFHLYLSHWPKLVTLLFLSSSEGNEFLQGSMIFQELRSPGASLVANSIVSKVA